MLHRTEEQETGSLTFISDPSFPKTRIAAGGAGPPGPPADSSTRNNSQDAFSRTQRRMFRTHGASFFDNHPIILFPDLPLFDLQRESQPWIMVLVVPSCTVMSIYRDPTDIRLGGGKGPLGRIVLCLRALQDPMDVQFHSQAGIWRRIGEKNAGQRMFYFLCSI